MSSIENCSYKECSTNLNGGGVYLYKSSINKNNFDKCNAKYGGGAFTLDYFSFKDFLKTSKERILKKDLSKSKIVECGFKNCVSEKRGSGVYCFRKKSIVNSNFENCNLKSKF